MELPSLLSPDFDFVRDLASEEILPALIQRSDATVVAFLESIAEDETWCGRNGDLLCHILQWLTTEFSSQRLSLALGKRVVDAIYSHRRVLFSPLPADLHFEHSEGKLEGNSLLYGMASPYLRRVIERRYKRGQVVQLAFPQVSGRVFHALQDYVERGSADHLWRDEEHALMQVMIQAAEWEMSGLLQPATLMMKRYITQKNAVNILRTAQTHLLVDLTTTTCEVINGMSLHIGLSSNRPGDLALTLDAFREANFSLLLALAPLLTTIAFREESGADPRAHELVKGASKVRTLDLSSTARFNMGLLEFFPSSLETLNLSDCRWMSEPEATQFINRFGEVNRISLSQDTQLTYTFWAKLRLNRQIQALDISYCRQIQDTDFELLTVAQTQLQELNMAWCQRVSEHQLSQLGKRCPNLQVLDVSHCPNMADRSLLEIVKSCPQLRTLNIASCPNVTEVGLAQAQRLLPHLDW